MFLRLKLHSCLQVILAAGVTLACALSPLAVSQAAAYKSPQTAGISATAISPGSYTLTWTSTNAVSADLNGAAVPLNGSEVVSPTTITTYRFTARSASGATDWGQVTVTPASTPTGTASGGAVTTFYVGPGGSDFNNGPQASPFATIQHADNVVCPRDSVVLAGGTIRGDGSVS